MSHEHIWVVDALVVGALFAIVVMGAIGTSMWNRQQPKPRGATRVL